jgi:hypothetical protein
MTQDGSRTQDSSQLNASSKSENQISQNTPQQHDPNAISQSQKERDLTKLLNREHVRRRTATNQSDNNDQTDSNKKGLSNNMPNPFRDA